MQVLQEFEATPVAAADPQYLEPTDVPQSVIDQEKEIAKSQTMVKKLRMMRMDLAKDTGTVTLG